MFLQILLLLLLLLSQLLLLFILGTTCAYFLAGYRPSSVAECDLSDEFPTPGGAGGLTPQSFYTLSPPLSNIESPYQLRNFLLVGYIGIVWVLF